VLQPGDDFFGLRLRNDPAFRQHPAMRDASLDVVGVEPPVEADGCGEPLHQRIGRFGESSTPGFFHFLGENKLAGEIIATG